MGLPHKWVPVIIFYRLIVLLLHVIVLMKYVVYFEPQITTDTFSDVTSYTWDELCHNRYHQRQGRSYSGLLPSSRVLAVSSLLGWPVFVLPVGMYLSYINTVSIVTYTQQQFYLNCTHLVPLFFSSSVLFL